MSKVNSNDKNYYSIIMKSIQNEIKDFIIDKYLSIIPPYLLATILPTTKTEDSIIIVEKLIIAVVLFITTHRNLKPLI